MIKWRVMKTPADRLRQLRKKRGFDTAADAAKAFGWNENTYKSHENGERGIKHDVAKKYAVAFKSTVAFILAGDEVPPAVQGIVNVALRGIVAAGMFRHSDWAPEDGTNIPAMNYKGVPPEKQYAVLVEGQSVNQKIQDGAYAICAEFSAMPGGATPGGLVHVVRERNGEVEHTIKELRYTHAGPMLYPASDDPAHQEPLPLKDMEHETVRIAGVVIGMFKPL